MKVKSSLFWLAVLLLALPVLAQAQQKEQGTEQQRSRVERMIRQLEEESRQATLKNDAAATNRLLAADWMNTNANGTVTTKPQLLELIRTSSFKFSSIENTDVAVRVYDGAAVVTGLSTTKRAASSGETITRQVRFTRVYAKQDGRWLVVAAQSTPVVQP